MKNQTPSHFSLVLIIDRLSVLSSFLQRGFVLKVQVGCSIRDLLCLQLNLTPEYIENHIKTIFLDGRPVDDIDAATIKDGATLALSAAMPGLVGATLRRGGFYSAFRSQITHHEDEKNSSLQEGTVTLKLFNLLTEELGPVFLSRGIWVREKDLEDFFMNPPDLFRSGCKAVRFDNEEITPDALTEMKWGDGTRLVKLTALQSS